MSDPSPVWHPFTQHALADPAVAIAHAEGATLYAEDGRAILDAISSCWVNTHGHGHPHIARAIADQAQKLEQVIFAGFTHEPAERLARKLVALARLPYVFFSDSGSTAVEVAIKMAVGCWHHRGHPRPRVIALEHGYHGDMFGAMSVGHRGVFTAAYEKMLFEVSFLPFPEAGREDRTLDALDVLLKANDFAALIIEPLVLGAGGMKMYAPALLGEIARRCREAGVFLIADEVMTGFGRTGTLFACEQAGITPDLLCLSKGITGGFLPLGATLASEEIYRAFFAADRARAFFHSSSYTGNAIACAAALANLEIWENEPVLARIEAIARHHADRLAKLVRPGVAARQTGSIAAVEIAAPDAGYLSDLAPRIAGFALARGVLLRPLGNVVYTMPPYCVSRAELEKIHDVIAEALDFAAQPLSASGKSRPRAALAQLAADPDLHARFLNTLSLLEHIGSRKIMTSQARGALDRDTLKHLAEETRHAFFFKRAAEATARRTLSYDAQDTIAGPEARAYMGRLDAFVAQAVSGGGTAAYLYMSLVVELRAIWLYRLYQGVLRDAGLALNLASVLAEEEKHLQEMTVALAALGEDAGERLPGFCAYEGTRFDAFLGALERELAVSRAAAE